jgi:hypothetical protein
MKTLYTSLTLMFLMLASTALGAEGQQYVITVKGMT